MQNYLRGAPVMTTIGRDSYASGQTSGQFSFLSVSLRRLYDAFTAMRQRQADRRTALYVRGLPDGVLLRLGVSAAELERLRRS
jgi:hypothetical protein